MKVPDHVSGSILLAFSIAVLVMALNFPPAIGNTLGPGVFPSVIAVGLGICGMLLIVTSLRRRLSGVNMDQEPEPVDESPLDLPSIGVMGLMLALPVFYIFAVQDLGFLITSLIIVFLSAYVLWGGMLRSALLAVAAVVVADGVFRGVFGIPLDVGLLSIPW